MKFSDFVSKKALCGSLTATDKESVIRELVGSLVESGNIDEAARESVTSKVMEREQLGTTGVGKGVAVPHAVTADVAAVVGTIGVSGNGVDFDSLDGEPVRAFFLLVSPEERRADHLKVLEKISRHVRDEMFCKFLKQSTSVEDIELLLDEADEDA